MEAPASARDMADDAADGELFDVFVCGRLCLLGEHSDWAGAYRSCVPGADADAASAARSRCRPLGARSFIHRHS